jgi:predicted O-methyltransferase YrrM
MSAPWFRLNPSVMSRVLWEDVLSEIELELPSLGERLTRAWQPCEATRAKMAYNTGSISPTTGIALYALARRLAPRTVFEIGTFIGKSTVAMALGMEDAGVRDGAIHTCDMSNDFHLQHAGTTRIAGYPRKGSTQALTEAAAAGAQVDLFHFDGRLAEADIALLGRLARPGAVFALDDYEGSEKGVANASLLKATPALRGHVLAYPPDRELLRGFGLHSRCLTAVLLPAALFGFTAQ